MNAVDKCPHGLEMAETCSECEDDRLAREMLVEKWRDEGAKHIANQVLGLLARLKAEREEAERWEASSQEHAQLKEEHEEELVTLRAQLAAKDEEIERLQKEAESVAKRVDELLEKIDREGPATPIDGLNEIDNYLDNDREFYERQAQISEDRRIALVGRTKEHRETIQMVADRDASLARVRADLESASKRLSELEPVAEAAGKISDCGCSEDPERCPAVARLAKAVRETTPQPERFHGTGGGR